jgi:hypothetical protein
MLKISPAVDALKDETMKEKKTNNFFSIGIKPWFRLCLVKNSGYLIS